MTVLVPVLGVALAAFCVWLTVRTINRKKKAGWKFWTALAGFALVFYVLSGSPLELIAMKMGEPEWLVKPARVIYAPFAWLLKHSPESVRRWSNSYDDWWEQIIPD